MLLSLTLTILHHMLSHLMHFSELDIKTNDLISIAQGIKLSFVGY